MRSVLEAFGDILVLLENEFLLGIRGTPWDRLLDIPSGTERPLALLGAGGHGASWRSHRRKLGRPRAPEVVRFDEHLSSWWPGGLWPKRASMACTMHHRCLILCFAPQKDREASKPPVRTALPVPHQAAVRAIRQMVVAIWKLRLG